MIHTPLANADSLRIGNVDFVSSDEIKVLLDVEAPNDVALNTGVPQSFPRINSYVLIPNDNGFLVAQIKWITIERSQHPKRKGMQDFGVIDLPYPLRKWCAFTLASAKAQRPTLIQALRFVRDRQLEPRATPSHDMRRFLRTIVSIISIEYSQGNP